jgi:hypothetical protein
MEDIAGTKEYLEWYFGESDLLTKEEIGEFFQRIETEKANCTAQPPDGIQTAKEMRQI